MPIQERFGVRLRTARIDQHYTLVELAARLEISTSALAKYEYGERFPSEATISKICQMLGLSEDWLLQGLNTAAKASILPVYVRKAKGTKANLIRKALCTKAELKQEKLWNLCSSLVKKNRGKEVDISTLKKFLADVTTIVTNTTE